MNIDVFKSLRDKARLDKDTDKVTFFATIVGELERIPNKVPTTEECLKVIKNFIEGAKEMLSISECTKTRWEKEFLEAMLPKEVSEEELKAVIAENLHNIGAAMKAVKDKFGVTANMQKAKEIFLKLKD